LCITAKWAALLPVWVKGGGPTKGRRGSAVFPIPDDLLCRSALPLSATTGREQVQQKTTLVDHLIGERKQLVWNLKPKRFGGFQIDHQLVLRRQLDW
jgi:hypothetical protein